MGIFKSIFKKNDIEDDDFYNEDNKLIDTIYQNINPELEEQIEAMDPRKAKKNKKTKASKQAKSVKTKKESQSSTKQSVNVKRVKAETATPKAPVSSTSANVYASQKADNYYQNSNNYGNTGRLNTNINSYDDRNLEYTNPLSGLDRVNTIKISKDELNQEISQYANRIDRQNQNITLLFGDVLPVLDRYYVEDVILSLERIATDVYISVEYEGNDGLIADIEFEDHKIKLAGLDIRYNEKVIDKTMRCSSLSNRDAINIQNHRSHIKCYYEGQSIDPIEIYIALYKVAYAFVPQGLIGIVNEEAWTCQSLDILKLFFTPKVLDAARKDPLVTVWTNSIKMPVDEGLWLFTKGNHIFGVTDFAYLGTVYEVKEINEIFNKIFKYVYRNKTAIRPGQTLLVKEGLAIRFREVYRENAYLEGPMGTLVMEKVFT